LNGGLAKNFGLFALGSRVIGETGQTCDRSIPCATWPVHCLTTELPWLPGTAADRAEAVADVWGGSIVDSLGLCSATTTTTTVVTTTRAPGSMPPLQPMRGVVYGALPCTASFGCGHPAEDMVQVGYEEQWGVKGRDDLGIMAKLGANSVRLYNSLGMDMNRDHSRFLDYSQRLGINVLPGYHLDASKMHGQCPGFDCFQKWKTATLEGFERGYKKGDSWHPAVAAAILLNEPDGFESLPECQPQGAWCRVKAAISALDGVLAAEKEAGVSAGRVRFTVTWSFATRESIDGEQRGPGNYGFQDMIAVVQNPQIAHYTPRTSLGDLQEAFRTRWVHGLNTKSPWNFVRDIISKDYHRFQPIPWFIGEYGASGQDEDTIRADLESMEAHALEDTAFVGAAFLQFQTNYKKGGVGMDFGMFGLGKERLAETGEVCQPGAGCRKFPVHCLTTKLSWLPGSKAHRAQAVASAWGGSVDHVSLCSDERRLQTVSGGTKLACQIGTDAASGGAGAVSAALNTDAFRKRITDRTEAWLDGSGDALLGDLSLANTAAWSVADVSQRDPAAKSLPSWTIWVVVSLVAMLLVVSVFFVVRSRKMPKQSAGSVTADQVV